jgi:hypothetical protein
MLIFSVVFFCVVVLLGTHALWVRTARRTRAESALRDLEAAVGQTEAAVDRIERDIARMAAALKSRPGDDGEAGSPEHVHLLAWTRARERFHELLRGMRSSQALGQRVHFALNYDYVVGAVSGPGKAPSLGKDDLLLWYSLLVASSARQHGKRTSTSLSDELEGLCRSARSLRDLLEEWESSQWDAPVWAHALTKRSVHRFSGESARRNAPSLPVKLSATCL